VMLATSSVARSSGRSGTQCPKGSVAGLIAHMRASICLPRVSATRSELPRPYPVFGNSGTRRSTERSISRGFPRNFRSDASTLTGFGVRMWSYSTPFLGRGRQDWRRWSWDVVILDSRSILNKSRPQTLASLRPWGSPAYSRA